jgi:hypothetical protein
MERRATGRNRMLKERRVVKSGTRKFAKAIRSLFLVQERLYRGSFGLEEGDYDIEYKESDVMGGGDSFAGAGVF